MTNLKTIFILSLSLMLPALLFCAPSFSAEVVMKSGERFETSQVWEQDGSIRFNMQGLIVTVEKNDVAEVIRQPAPLKPHQASDPLSDPIEGTTTATPHPNTSTHALGPDAKPHRQAALSKPSQAPLKELPLGISNQSTGFQGVYWQMKSQDMPNLAKVETDPAFGGIDQYRRTDQSLRWGGVVLDGWVYGFWRDQLYSIMMWIDGRNGYDHLYRQVINLFGPGNKDINGLERYVWVAPGTQRMLEFDAQLNVGILVMRSSVVDAQIKARYPSP